MKHINRSSPLSHFTYFVAKKPKQWKDLAINNYMLYDDCRKTLAQDQDGKSGYTELPLTKKPNVWHIDHFLKQDHFPRHKNRKTSSLTWRMEKLCHETTSQTMIEVEPYIPSKHST